MLSSCLYSGQVMHQRLAPVGHRFSYRVMSLLLDLDEMPGLGLHLLSHNRPNLFSVHDADLAEGTGAPRQWIETELARHGIRIDGGRVRVHLFPRVMGWGFTPLTTWFCHEPGGRLAAVLYEVHNTFRERHAYLVRIDDDPPYRHSADKCFHVSPLIGPDGTYAFTLRDPGESFGLTIRETDRATGRPIMVASHVGRRRALTDGALLKAALAYPMLPLKIVGGIHFEALRLWLKGAPFHRKPAPPTKLVTMADQGDFA